MRPRHLNSLLLELFHVKEGGLQHVIARRLELGVICQGSSVHDATVEM